MEIYEAFEALGDYVDSADPDVEFPNVRLAKVSAPWFGHGR